MIWLIHSQNELLHDQIKGWMDEWKRRQVDKWRIMDGCMDEWMNVDELTDGWIKLVEMCGWVEITDGCVDG